MKKLIFISLSFLLIQLSLFSQTAIKPDGEGTKDIPYLVVSWQNLYWISLQGSAELEKHYIQIENIDLADADPPIESWYDGKGWRGINGFKGTYNGQYHTISNLYMDRNYTASGVGFFRSLFSGAKIFNIVLLDVDVKGENLTGGLVGVSYNSYIDNCFVTGTVESTSRGGGLVGSLNNSYLNNSFSEVNVSGNGLLNGGLVGMMFNSEVKNSYTISNVSRTTGSDTWIGAFTGSITDSSVENCYAVGNVFFENGSDPGGKGFSGYLGSNPSCSNNYFDHQASNQAQALGATAKNTAEMQTQDTFIEWDFDNVWEMNEYPALKKADKRLLALNAIAYDNSKGVVSGSKVFKPEDIPSNLIWVSASPKVGYRFVEFIRSDGSFYTSSQQFYYVKPSVTHTILAIFEEDPDYIPEGEGIIANPYEIASWKNLYWLSQNPEAWDKYFVQVANIDFNQAEPPVNTWNDEKGFSPVGNIETPFSGSYTGEKDGVRYSISGLFIDNPQQSNVGLFGVTFDAVISDVSLDNVFINGNDFVASLVGYAENTTIINSYAQGKVDGIENIGGLAGKVVDTQIQKSYFKGELSGIENIGGLVGFIDNSEVSNAYANVEISRTQEDDISKNRLYELSIPDNNTNSLKENSFAIGLFTGYINESRVNNTYTLGSVFYEGEDDPTDKGFIGFIDINVSFANNFFGYEASNQETGAGADAKTNEQMQVQNTFEDAGWDFTSIWIMGEYPKLINIGEGVLIEFTVEPNYERRGSVSGSGHYCAGYRIPISANPFPGHQFEQWIDDGGNELTTDADYFFIMPSEQVNLTAVFHEDDDLVPEGEGIEEEPFIIANWKNLYWLSQNPEVWDSYFIQTAHIDFEDAKPEIENWNENTGWMPIGNKEKPFAGNYNGQKFIIYNLYGDGAGINGFFGFTDAAILNNIYLDKVNFSGIEEVGGLAAKMLNTDAVNCFSSGIIYSSNLAGGLVGIMNSGSIAKSFSEGSVHSDKIAGGLIGYVKGENSHVSDTYSQADVNSRSFSEELRIGAFAGFVEEKFKVLNSYATGNVYFSSGSDYTNKGFIGIHNSEKTDKVFFEANFFDAESSNQNTAIGADPKTTSEMQIQSTFESEGWDFDDVWFMYDYPKLTNVGILPYNVSLTVNDDDMGSATGTGDYLLGSVVEISAEPLDGHQFYLWGNLDGLELIENTKPTDEIVKFRMIAKNIEIQAVFKRSQHIVFEAPEKIYGDANFDPAQASSNLQVTYTSSNENVATIIDNGTKISIVGVGASFITASQPGNDIYAAAGNVQQTLTVFPKTIYISPLANQSKIYGDVDPEFEYTNTGLLGSDELSGVLGRESGQDVGLYHFTIGTLSAGNNYNPVIMNNPEMFEITSKEIFITPLTGQSKIYGSSDPEFAYNQEGLIENDTMNGLIGRSEGEDVADYDYNLGTLNAGSNYNLLLAEDSPKFTIDPKSITILPSENQEKVYGENDPVLNYSNTNLIGEDEITGNIQRITGENVGGYGFTLGTLDAGKNYTLVMGEDAPVFNIVPKSITIYPDENQGKVYGSPDPEFDYSCTSLFGNDQLSGQLQREEGELVGIYQFTLGSLDAGINYSLFLANEAPLFSINPLELTIEGTFTALDKEYDGTTDATIDDNSLTLLTPINGDLVSLTGIVVEFADVEVSDDKIVSITAAALDGADKGNYTLSLTGAPTTTASITAPAAETYTLNLLVSPENVGTVTGGGEYEEGDEVNVTAAPLEGYQFLNWRLEGATISADSSFTYTMPAANANLVAHFVEDDVETYTLSLLANPEEGGFVDGGGEFAEGEVVTITATPAEGFVFVSWSDEVAETLEVSTTFTMPAEDIIITAIFEEYDDETELFTITFIVSCEIGAVKEAVITFEDMNGELVTDENGMASIDLINGIYNYLVSADGYTEIEGVVNVSGSDLNQIVNLQALSTTNTSMSKIVVYPNPFSNNITIKNINNAERIIFTNILGQIVKDVQVDDLNSVTVTTNELEKGIYLIQIISKVNGSGIIKILKN